MSFVRDLLYFFIIGVPGSAYPTVLMDMIFETTIQNVVQRTPSVKSFQINLPQAVEFKAGQFLQASLLVNGKEEGKYFTISSSPSEKRFVEFTKRITESPFSQALDQIGPGGWMKISMPMGRFTLDRAGADAKIAFLSGGIGITPIISMCRSAADQNLDRDMILLYGNRTQDDVPFKEEWEELTRRLPRLRVVHVLESPPEGWEGHAGYITKETVVSEIPDYRDRAFFVCGPPGMVAALSGILEKDLSLPREQIITENFDGY